MALMRYTSKENQPLLEMLNHLFAQYGFAFVPKGAPGRSDIAIWRKPLGPTLKAEISITLNSSLPPNTWSLGPTVMIDSSYVAHWFNTLRLHRDFYPIMSSFREEEYLQVLRFSPAYIRWQERLDLEVAVLKGRPETITHLKDEFADVCERYIMPVLAGLRDPLAVAEFQLHADTGFRATRIDWDEPRYNVSTPWISTALLFDEAGETVRALASLEQMHEELSRRWVTEDPARTKPKFGQLDRLLEHLRDKARADSLTRLSSSEIAQGLTQP